MTTKAKAPNTTRDMRNPQPTDDEITSGGLNVKVMRQIVKAMEALHDLCHSTEYGDIGVTLGGVLSVYSGEGDESGEAELHELVGWLIQVEDWWEFLPVMPTLYWSDKQSRFVDLETIRAENIAGREKSAIDASA